MIRMLTQTVPGLTPRVRQVSKEVEVKDAERQNLRHHPHH